MFLESPSINVLRAHPSWLLVHVPTDSLPQCPAGGRSPKPKFFYNAKFSLTARYGTPCRHHGQSTRGLWVPISPWPHSPTGHPFVFLWMALKGGRYFPCRHQLIGNKNRWRRAIGAQGRKRNTIFQLVFEECGQNKENSDDHQRHHQIVQRFGKKETWLHALGYGV